MDLKPEVEAFEKKLRYTAKTIGVENIFLNTVECEDESILIEVYCGKQGDPESRRLGFSFEKDGHSFYWHIAKKKPYFVEDGEIKDLDLEALLKRFYRKT
jgi:hypothetical protein